MAVWLLWRTPFEDYGLKHLALVIVGFVGITGHLPNLSTGLRPAIIGLGAATIALADELVPKQ